MMSGFNYTYPAHLSTATVAQLVEQLIRNQFALLLGYTLFSSISCQLTVQFICQFGRRQATQGVNRDLILA